VENLERQKESKGAYKKEKIQTAELNRRDQVTAAKSWPSSLRKEGNRGRLSGSSTYWIKYTHLAPSDNRSTKGADGRVATGAAWLKGRDSQREREEQNILTRKEKKERKTYLTLIGALMEGALAVLSVSWELILTKGFEVVCNCEFSCPW
jgi:hypothetical protein